MTPTDENKELLRKYNHAWKRIKDEIKEISSGECDYEKEYMKIKQTIKISQYDCNYQIRF